MANHEKSVFVAATLFIGVGIMYLFSENAEIKTRIAAMEKTTNQKMKKMEEKSQMQEIEMQRAKEEKTKTEEIEMQRANEEKTKKCADTLKNGTYLVMSQLVAFSVFRPSFFRKPRLEHGIVRQAINGLDRGYEKHVFKFGHLVKPTTIRGGQCVVAVYGGFQIINAWNTRPNKKMTMSELWMYTSFKEKLWHYYENPFDSITTRDFA